MISAYGQPAALSVALPSTEDGAGSPICGRSTTSSNTAISNSSRTQNGSSPKRIVTDIQVSPCGLFIAVLSPCGVRVYSNGQCRMLLGRCLVPQDSEVYGRLCCCCWASDSSALFVSADPLACVCVFSIGSSSTGSSGLVQQQLQKIQQQSTASEGKGVWGAASSSAGVPLTAGTAAEGAAAVRPGAVGESWLMEGFSTAIDTQHLGNTGTTGDGDGQGSEGEEEQLQPAAAENASTAEEAIRSVPSAITAYRPLNTSPLSVSFCLLLRLPVRPSALCCASVQRQQPLLLAGCSRQPALFWLHLGGPKQVLGCMYTTDLIRVTKRAGVCPGNADPSSAAVVGVASTAATRVAWSGAIAQGKTSAAAASLGCACRACEGRCCCFVDPLALPPMGRRISSNGTSAGVPSSAAGAPSPSSRRCRCRGRRRLITYLFHPKGYTSLTELLRLPAPAQDAHLVPDLPDVFLCADSGPNCGGPLHSPLGCRSASTSRCSRLSRIRQKLRKSSCSSLSGSNIQQHKQDELAGVAVFDRCEQGHKIGGQDPLSTSQQHQSALFSSGTINTTRANSNRHRISSTLNRTESLTIRNAEASGCKRTTNGTGTIRGLRDSAAGFGLVNEEICNSVVDAQAAPADDSISSSDGGTSDDRLLQLGTSRLPTRGVCTTQRLERRKKTQRQHMMRSLTDEAFSDYETLHKRCCGGVRQLQLNQRLDLLAVVTAAGELLMLSWRFPLRGYTQVDDLDSIQQPASDAGVAEQPLKVHLASQHCLKRLNPEVPASAAAGSGPDIADVSYSASIHSQLNNDTSTSSAHTRCRGCGSICIGAGLDGRVSIGHSTREGFVDAPSVSETCHSSSNTNSLRPWRPLGLQLRAEAVCCCALNGERSLVAVGLGSGFVEVYRLIWPRSPVQRVRNSRKPQQQQTDQRPTRRTHRNIERDGFTLLPQLINVIRVPDDIMAAATQHARTRAAHTAAGDDSTTSPPYVQACSVQSLQWTADGAALAVRWLRGGTAVFSHTGSILFSLPDLFTAEPGPAASGGGQECPFKGSPWGLHRLRREQKRFHGRQAPANAAATAAAIAAGAAIGSGQLCSWIMGGLSLMYVCPCRRANSGLHPDGERAERGTHVSSFEADTQIQIPSSEELLEVAVVRSASVAAAASSVDVCGSRCASDMTDRVMVGGSHLLVWSFLDSMRESASLSLVPLPPSLYTTKAFPVRQAALSPDGSQMLVAGSRGFALFALLQRRWRLLCMERQEAQLLTGTLPLGWYTKDIFFVSTPAFDPSDTAASSAAAAVAPEPLCTLSAPDAAPRWLLPPSIFHRFQAAVAAAVDFCPSRFASHVPLTIHEKTAWLQQQQQQLHQSSSRLWGAAGAGRGSAELSAIATAAASRGTSSSSGSSAMWYYAVLFLRSSERLDLRCRVAEIKRLQARPHTTTVLPSMQQQQLLRPAGSLGSRCCLCHHEGNSHGSCCMVCSGRAAVALRSFAAGNTDEPLLAIYDAMGVLTAYQLQQPQQQKEHQPRQQDVVALWQLDLSDFCDRPPQQIRFVGCAWLLLALLQSGALLLLRLGMPGAGHLSHQRKHNIPRLIVETFTVVADGVTGLWVGAEAQLQQHYMLPSSRFCVLRPQQQHHMQIPQGHAGIGMENLARCSCSCLGQETMSPRQNDRNGECLQMALHQYKPTSCGPGMEAEVALKQTGGGSGPDSELTLSDNKLSAWSAGVSSSSNIAAASADLELWKAKAPLPWPLTARKLRGSSGVSIPHGSHQDTHRSNLLAPGTALSPPFFVGPLCTTNTNSAAAPAPHCLLPYQRIVDFPRPVAVEPVLSKSCSTSDLYKVPLQRQQEEELPEHLVRERRAPLSLPVLTAGSSNKTSGAMQRDYMVSGSTPEDSGGLQGSGTSERRIRRPFQTFWTAGCRQHIKYIQQSKGDGSKDVAGATASEANSETQEAVAAPERFSSSAVRGEPPVVDSDGCSGSGLDSSPAVRGPVVAAQPWETRIGNCDVCCCCVAGWHIWAQTPAGLLLASVGFHYSGAAAAAATEGSSPESLLSVTDVRLRSALVLPVESRPQPLQIVGVIGELGVAVACTASREASLGCPVQIQPVTRIRLLLQPCTHALLQRQLLAAVARIPESSREPCMLVEGRAFDAASEGHVADCTSCGVRGEIIDTNQGICSSRKRLFLSVSALVRELLASAFAHHLLELAQFGLLMRCISTYLKAAKLRRVQLRPHNNREHPLLHPSTARGEPCVDSISRGDLGALAGSVRTAAAAALGSSSEGAALEWFLRLLQRKSPHMFVATLVFCMRKTEPLVSPAVLESLLQRQVPPADPVTLFTKCLERGLLQTASLYLLPIQTTEGPLQVRCRRVLPLLRAALAAGDFLLTRKLLHFFWAFFRRRHNTRPISKRSKVQREQASVQSASEGPTEIEMQLLRQRHPAGGQQKSAHTRRAARMSSRLTQLRSLLWRPVQTDEWSSSPAKGSTGKAGVDCSFLTNPWLSRVPLELRRVDRLLAAQVYREVEAAVAAAASALLKQHKWLQLFDFATTLGVDLPAWLRGRSKSDLLDRVNQPNTQTNQEQIPWTEGLAISSTAKTVPERAGPRSTTATGGAAPTAAQVLSRLFSEAVCSFTQQLCIGDMPVSLCLKQSFVRDCSRLFMEERCQQQSPSWKDGLQVAALLETACRQSPKYTACVVPPLCSNGNRQQQATSEMARYLARVLLLSGHPVYTLALAAAVRDREAAAQILSWYPQLRCFFSTTVLAAWADEAEGPVAFSKGHAPEEGMAGDY